MTSSNAILNIHETTHRRLTARAFEPLPLGTVLPTGWLCDQLRVQANGLTGHLDEFWPSVSESRWIGGAAEGWERAPYWLDGLIPVSVLLNDADLIAKAQRWLDYILEHQHDDGWLGPKDDPHEGTGEVTLDPWPQFVLFKVFTQWEEATQDPRVVPALMRAAKRIAVLLDEKPLQSWAKMRWADLALSLYWLYERTREEWLLDLVDVLQQQGYDWDRHFRQFRHTEKTERSWLDRHNDDECLPLHGVNNAMGVKSSAVWSRRSGEASDAQTSLLAVEMLERYHGQVTGMFSGDEHLAGRNPIQGTETCTVVEYLFTLEQMLAITGNPALADRLEQIVYNALPAAMTKDMWTRQYDQQPNQALCSVGLRDWSSNGPHSNLFSVEGNFGCCTANLHQGWPKFASHLWMKSPDNGLAAIAYAPCRVKTEINGVSVTLEEKTDYPFRDLVNFTVNISSPVTFPLQFRIPGWAKNATLSLNGGSERSLTPGTFYHLERQWVDGDQIALHLPMNLRLEKRFHGSVSVLRGPLVMALQIGEDFRKIGKDGPHPDWEVYPTTPWNYAFMADISPDEFSVEESPISIMPFDTQASPVTVTVAAHRLPHWHLVNDSAALPLSDTNTDYAASEKVTLIPYGSTHLRISEIPVIVRSEVREHKAKTAKESALSR